MNGDLDFRQQPTKSLTLLEGKLSYRLTCADAVENWAYAVWKEDRLYKTEGGYKTDFEALYQGLSVIKPHVGELNPSKHVGEEFLTFVALGGRLVFVMFVIPAVEEWAFTIWLDKKLHQIGSGYKTDFEALYRALLVVRQQIYGDKQ